jgi:muramoyltetrapeptide carboxypeptidase LdcA involved in peptidoglycan recycling
MFGRPKDYTEEERQELYTIVMNIMKKEFNVTGIPVVMNMDFGHTDPKVILPLGCLVEIDPEVNRIKLLESPFI